MLLKGAVFLAARTTRSQAYAQALLRAGLVPEHVVVFGAADAGRLGQAASPPPLAVSEWRGVAFPDLSEPLSATLERMGCAPRLVAGQSVKSAGVAEALAALGPRVVVYSGYGGEIVPAELCARHPFLHVHSGWLPEYRGSTTVYYSLLREGCCGASAILLRPEIDTGPVLLRRRYPPPPPGVDIDHVYDTAIRADLLVRALQRLDESGGWPCEEQQEAVARTYFIIHPVLKNMVADRIAKGTLASGEA